MTRRAVITGYGIATAAGTGRGPFGAALEAGASLARPITLVDASGFPCAVACEVPGLDPRKLARVPKEAKVLARASLLALAALEDLRSSVPAPWTADVWSAGFFLGVGLEQGDHRDVLAPLAASARGRRIDVERLAREGLPAMNPLSSLKTLPNMALAHVAMKLGEAAPRGPNAAYSPFDSASLEAIGAAAAAVAGGECELALAGGADAPVSLFGLTTFSRIRAPGMVPLGEAAALFLVEEASAALAAGRTPLAEIAGFGSASDGEAVGEPSADGFAHAVAAAHEAAGEGGAREPDALVVSGHADRSAKDVAGVEAVLGGPARALPRIAPRAVFGQCVAAGGALGAAAALHALATHDARRVLITAGAFGGSYAALLLKRWAT